MAPPILSRTGPDGRPGKRGFGPGAVRLIQGLSRFKILRGTPFDPFGYSAERRMERDLIHAYEADMDEVLRDFSEERRNAAVALAELPLQIRGFGAVKAANAKAARKRRDELMADFRGSGREAAQAAQ
jgi:indolepyruvate ferredoxin oxidoreductase